MGRLGIYVDDVYRIDSTGSVSVDRAFLLFACAVGNELGGTTLFGRTVQSESAADYRLPRVELAPLAHYSDLKNVREVAGSLVGTVRGMWRGLDRVDVVWVFGPHPFAFVLVLLSAVRRRRIVLGVRQDTVRYAVARLAGRRGTTLALGAVRIMDLAYRALGRILPTTAVGDELAGAYGPRALAMTVTLVPESALTKGVRNVGARPRQLLTVGRIDREKNPLLVVEMLAELERRDPGGQELTWVGRGPLEGEVRARAAELGVEGLIDLRGYVPFGDGLLTLYRQADVFIHVSKTEGVPQVLVEAFTAGTPVVATAVGGVPRATAYGQAALLVPPSDRDALVAAVRELLDNEPERRRVAGRALELGRKLTLETEAARVARYVRG
jgi:glycosyltransferase involved in cell wall biosynthesis